MLEDIGIEELISGIDEKVKCNPNITSADIIEYIKAEYCITDDVAIEIVNEWHRRNY